MILDIRRETSFYINEELDRLSLCQFLRLRYHYLVAAACATSFLSGLQIFRHGKRGRQIEVFKHGRRQAYLTTHTYSSTVVPVRTTLTHLLYCVLTLVVVFVQENNLEKTLQIDKHTLWTKTTIRVNF